MQKLKRGFKILLLATAISYCLLLIPDSEKNRATVPAEKPFAWELDNFWKQLEKEYAKAKSGNSVMVDSAISNLFLKEQALYLSLNADTVGASDKRLDSFLFNYFQLAPLVAVRPQYRQKLLKYYNLARKEVKQQSCNWNINDMNVRNVLYKLLYGMRIATEEILLQADSISFDPVLNVQEELSSTPVANIFGIKVHSGDLLLSRGGAEVSALISRGNNYPGNFSHVALLYVEEKTNRAYLVEAHIEKGVAVSSAEQYIKDKKLRFMVLRPRADLSQIKSDSMLPHKAAMAAYNAAISRHIPYDFKMDFADSNAMFCSEVGSFAYKKMGLQLWQSPSTISSPGVIKWLGDFGVENFITQMPSDLEYDTQLSVVAEWRNPETLMKDHIDNAVMDALLEQADKGKEIDYNIWQLPVVRLIKLWCVIKNMFGGVGIIPEGMSATKALKNNAFVSMYNTVKEKTEIKAVQFIKEYSYHPPYWQLVAMAKKSAEEK
jgi:hypothetical protein